jgi:hypothetical protein
MSSQPPIIAPDRLSNSLLLAAGAAISFLLLVVLEFLIYIFYQQARDLLLSMKIRVTLEFRKPLDSALLLIV